MALLTGDEYRESLRDQRRVWIGGEVVPDVTAHPAFRPMVDVVARIYDMHHQPEFADALTMTRLGGQRVSRFYAPPRTAAELRARRLMTQTVLDEVGPTIDRFGDETVTPLFVMLDRQDLMDRFDPRWHANVANWIERLLVTNLFMTSGNTDMKGNRARHPQDQQDPDLYLRVVDERDNGIVIRGAKYETGASYAHVAFVKPTVGVWSEANRDYAVACIVKMNAPGVRHICRAPLAPGADVFDRPLSAGFDEIDTLIIFDDVFIPAEDVIFSRVPALAQAIRSELTQWAAQGFLLRSLAKADVMVGTACLLAEQTRAIAIPEVKQRIAQLMVYRETLHAFVLAAEAACETTRSGLFMPNQAIQHAGRVYAATNYHSAVHHLRDIAGGSLIVAPDRRSLDCAEIADDIRKYFRIDEVTAEARIRVLNLANDLTASAYAGRAQAYQIFAESPIYAQANSLYAAFDRSSAMRRAARLAGLPA